MALPGEKDTRERIPFINIYGPVLYNEKAKLWDLLGVLKERNSHINNIMGGDFNTVLNTSEKRGGSSNRDPEIEWRK